jgi:TolB protein
MGGDGSAPTRLTTGAGEDMSPTWSPDGSTIAFVSSRDGGHDVYRVHPDGTALERLTIGAVVTRDLSQWSPDGRSIAFISDRDGYDALYVADASGANARRITSEPSLNPAWKP